MSSVGIGNVGDMLESCTEGVLLVGVTRKYGSMEALLVCLHGAVYASDPGSNELGLGDKNSVPCD